jgi:hypothetical protein
MRFPPMKYTATWLTPNDLELEITHHIAQSFSRAVDPKATQIAKAAIPGGTWELHNVTYATTCDQSCTSIYSYRRTGHATPQHLTVPTKD